MKNSCQQRYLPNFSLTGAFCGKEVKTPLQNARQQNLGMERRTDHFLSLGGQGLRDFGCVTIHSDPPYGSKIPMMLQ